MDTSAAYPLNECTPLSAGAEFSAQQSPWFPSSFGKSRRHPASIRTEGNTRTDVDVSPAFRCPSGRASGSPLCLIVAVFIYIFLHANFDCAIEIKLQYIRVAPFVALRSPKGRELSVLKTRLLECGKSLFKVLGHVRLYTSRPCS